MDCFTYTPHRLGPVAGTIGALDAGHPLLVSLRNLRRWYATDGMGEWLHGLRLFSLTMNGYSLEEGKALAEKNYEGLVKAGIWQTTSCRTERNHECKL